ncbi:phosphoribosylanthranilate isomerase [Alkalibacillus almallahensis]|uniref:phosphoribosylanthranilate isomerase n=1 Tax=Alkalibacillus almallahensis TaxID=1379154 RepID=UPI001420B148|nr:phosphoribosylanthranilate isomerase [Alkalibacillus almallahensis]NIK12073.1 phosphoribosylanthranilate isomerase [Alkalibacillus almallahensis]
MTGVKICGIRQTSHAEAAETSGADMIGFVFAESKRKVSIEQAKHIASTLPASIQKVGVFVNASKDTLEQTAYEVGLDYVQLHGDEPPEFCEQLNVPYIKSFRINTVADLEKTKPYTKASYLLLDSASGPYQGGNGTTFDWSVLDHLPFDRSQLILAGGLNTRNINQAIEQTTPAIVDVSSGVEQDGQKSNQLIKNFIKLVKES